MYRFTYVWNFVVFTKLIISLSLEFEQNSNKYSNNIIQCHDVLFNAT